MWKTLSSYRTALLLYGLGLFAFAAGMWKMQEPTTWVAYAPGRLLGTGPLTDENWMHVVGVIETLAGVALLSHWRPYVWSTVIAGWLTLVAAALWSTGQYVMAFSYIGLVLFALATSAEAYRVHFEGIAA